MPPMLSDRIVMVPLPSLNPSSFTSPLIHSASLAACPNAIYSLSVDDVATVVCNLLFHAIAPPQHTNTNPALDCVLSLSSLYSACEYPRIVFDRLDPNRMPICLDPST